MRGQKYFSVALASVISTGDPKTVSVQTGKFLRLPFSGQLQRERKSRSRKAQISLNSVHPSRSFGLLTIFLTLWGNPYNCQHSLSAETSMKKFPSLIPGELTGYELKMILS